MRHDLRVFDFAIAYHDHCEESAWASVDDELPRIHEKVIISGRDGNVSVADFGIWDRVGGRFIPGWLGYKDGYITHWRPLPENPQKISATNHQ